MAKEIVEISIVGKVAEKGADLQRKVVTPTSEVQIITADEGYYGLGEVIVNPSELDGNIILDKIDDLDSNVEDKLNDYSNSIADNVNSIKEVLTQGTATPEDITKGKTAFVNGKKVVGTMENPQNNGYILVNSPYGKKAILLSKYKLEENVYKGNTLIIEEEN